MHIYMYTLAYVLEYLAAIIWNKLFSVRSIKNKKNKSFNFHLFPSSCSSALYVDSSFDPSYFSSKKTY